MERMTLGEQLDACQNALCLSNAPSAILSERDGYLLVETKAVKPTVAAIGKACLHHVVRVQHVNSPTGITLYPSSAQPA